MPEGMREGSWEEQQKHMGPDFHLEDKKDAVEVLIDHMGWDGAVAEIEDNLQKNPEDAEARRQAALILKLNDDRMASLRRQMGH